MKKLLNLHVTVYVTGSIACYKTLTLIRLLKHRGAEVRVVMSRGAREFINPVTFKTISGNAVISDRSWLKSNHQVPHVDLARWTDIAIVMPATANVIAKIANGIADGVVSTCLLATSRPKIIVPAMNNHMWLNPATQKNVKLIDRWPSVRRMGPVYGKLAEDYSGTGRMMDPQQVLEGIEKFLKPQILKGFKLLVTAGGTREFIDPVRFITNASSGKMGFAIAKRAYELGANVTLVTGHTDRPAPKGIHVIKAKTTEDMERTVLALFPHYQGLIMSAALADFEPVKTADQKIKKASSTDASFNLKFKRTPDVLRNVAKIKRPGQLTIGFAAETQHLIPNALGKLRTKKLDLIVANDVSKPKIGFSSDDDQVTFIDYKGNRTRTPVESKEQVADQLLKIVAKLKDDRS